MTIEESNYNRLDQMTDKIIALTKKIYKQMNPWRSSKEQNITETLLKTEFPNTFFLK